MIHHPDSRVEREREREKVTKREVRALGVTLAMIWRPLRRIDQMPSVQSPRALGTVGDITLRTQASVFSGKTHTIMIHSSYPRDMS